MGIIGICFLLFRFFVWMDGRDWADLILGIESLRDILDPSPPFLFDQLVFLLWIDTFLMSLNHKELSLLQQDCKNGRTRKIKLIFLHSSCIDSRPRCFRDFFVIVVPGFLSSLSRSSSLWLTFRKTLKCMSFPYKFQVKLLCWVSRISESLSI